MAVRWPWKPWKKVPGHLSQCASFAVGFDMINAIAEAEGISLSTIQLKALLGKAWTDWRLAKTERQPEDNLEAAEGDWRAGTLAGMTATTTPCDRVSVLKRLTTDIHDEVDNLNRMLERMVHSSLESFHWFLVKVHYRKFTSSGSRRTVESVPGGFEKENTFKMSAHHHSLCSL
ncbi:hypothetical protein R1flu_024834 [Riccia fluitans]|uniref:Uncharacterized protein n=1 Tax=Riccia fluitans TaxID=41844 RepID=A0ABD1XW19_9MARC